MKIVKLAVALFFILFCNVSLANENGLVVRSCSLLEEPYRDAKEIAYLDKDATIKIVKKKGGWLLVSTGKDKGWVRMFNVRRGKTKARKASAKTEAKGVLGLASGRAGRGNVVAATGVRGLGEEDLKAAEFNAEELKKVESFSISVKQAKQFAGKAQLSPKSVDYLLAK